jgi:hypothetical protein
MTEPGPRLEYAGFVNTGAAREFSFRVQTAGVDTSRTVVLVIADEAFAARRARLQDGPDICYQKLLRILAGPLAPLPERIVLSEEDLYHYSHAHAPKPSRRRPPVTTSPASREPAVDPEPGRDPFSTEKA